MNPYNHLYTPGESTTKEQRAEMKRLNEPTPRKITLEEWNRYWPDEPYPHTFTPSTQRGANKHTIKRERVG